MDKENKSKTDVLEQIYVYGKKLFLVKSISFI